MILIRQDNYLIHKIKTEAYQQQSLPFCIGGQGTSPYEQNTQQSPCFGLKTFLHSGHSQKNWQESVGIVSLNWCPQFGQVIIDLSSGSFILLLSQFSAGFVITF